MSDVVYVSKSSIERKRGPLRIAHLPGESQPIIPLKSDSTFIVLKSLFIWRKQSRHFSQLASFRCLTKL
jgi:hypothetical protein